MEGVEHVNNIKGVSKDTSGHRSTCGISTCMSTGVGKGKERVALPSELPALVDSSIFVA